MKIVKIIALALVVALAVFAVAANQQPDTFHVARSATMKAKPEAIFAQVNNLHKWDAWSPWAKLDPNAKHSFAGPEEGKDAAMSWDGNFQVGKGTMTITESQSPSTVKFHLDFEKPMKGTNTAEFMFVPQGDETVVTWSMIGNRNFVAKAMSLVFNCEKIVGGNFEQGLASLKQIVEAKP